MGHKILILPGDGIGPEIVAEALKLLDRLRAEGTLNVELEHGLIGGAALDARGTPLPDDTLALAQAADAVLLGAIGGPRWDHVDRAKRPERGLLELRAALNVFANLRPAIMYPPLVGASTLKPDIVSGLDIMIVRELTGGIYFGEPRGIRRTSRGEREGLNTLVYRESEIARICRVAFGIAAGRGRRVCSVDKANVLEVSELWREVAQEVGREFPDVELSHMYVDNAAMQLVRAPKQFDVLVTSNMFGDILSDLASMLTGSIGMLPSASLDETGKGVFEPVHGSAPDIAGTGQANPLATLLSTAMLLRHSLNEPEAADRIERAVERVLESGLRTADIGAPGTRVVETTAMGNAVVAALDARAE
ncbi:MAG: 3-isopropylmalate dehydrogenase [Gammaproteobacteria bacterium]|nr:3-isopropylmalate dehydrogenase [Gammaproteobacteria bacterium]NIR83096.1 3-isopropylmalate dehydrogenase [Gammaproteobacteria bacterium]NIR90758.1 3-isopropylmalate dehydrogenase [Gammaproteobacteria bacterium]NIU04249.1 3-isopropylmalate dehydrogenase [Gammaproteobacteria bacterium]NIV51541.1 3-isopropylmalate dehydrogenase [Gammaproteobacteria bacterium]